VDLFQLLVESGADLNITMEKKRTLMHSGMSFLATGLASNGIFVETASLGGSVEIICRLIDK
jgi:hypothetical protein